MTEFKHFRNTLTGKVGYYPEDFGDLFYDTFIEVDSSAADCVDCWLKPDEDIVDDFAFDTDDDDDFPTPVVESNENEDK